MYWDRFSLAFSSEPLIRISLFMEKPLCFQALVPFRVLIDFEQIVR